MDNQTSNIVPEKLAGDAQARLSQALKALQNIAEQRADPRYVTAKIMFSEKLGEQLKKLPVIVHPDSGILGKGAGNLAGKFNGITFVVNKQIMPPILAVFLNADGEVISMIRDKTEANDVPCETVESK